MPEWIELIAADECLPGQSREIVVGDRIVALYNIEGEFYALDGICPHQGGPLAKGVLDGCLVSCPWHGWQFDVRSGQSQLSAKLVQPQFGVRVEDGMILIDLADPRG